MTATATATVTISTPAAHEPMADIKVSADLTIDSSVRYVALCDVFTCTAATPHEALRALATRLEELAKAASERASEMTPPPSVHVSYSVDWVYPRDSKEHRFAVRLCAHGTGSVYYRSKVCDTEEGARALARKYLAKNPRLALELRRGQVPL